MAGITSKMCTDAVTKVFGTIPDFCNVAQGMVESGMSRVDTSKGINMNDVPDFVLEQMAESAAWYVSDNDLRRNPKGLSVHEIREQIAEYLFVRFPRLGCYAR